MSDGLDPGVTVPSRPLPELTPENEFFWTSGRDGVLRVQRSIPCGALLFPPTPVCPYCHSTEIDVVEVSGRATVVGYTVNVHQWLPAMSPPYVIAMVALEEDDRVRLTTNVVGCAPDAVQIGMRVAVEFEQQDDVWFPLFAPTGDPEPGPLPAEDATKRRARPMASSDKFEDKVAISGIGMSELGRRLMRDPLSLAVEACVRAIDDAGLAPRRHRRSLDLSGRRWRGHRPLGGRDHRGGERLAAAPDLDQWGTRNTRAVRLDRQRDARGGLRSLPARALLPHRVGVDPRGAPATRAYPARWRPHRRRHAMADPLRRDVGRELDRDERVAAHAPLRHDPRNTRLDRVERVARTPLATRRPSIANRSRWTTTSRHE